jgi:hypothetical protein
MVVLGFVTMDRVPEGVPMIYIQYTRDHFQQHQRPDSLVSFGTCRPSLLTDGPLKEACGIGMIGAGFGNPPAVCNAANSGIAPYFIQLPATLLLRMDTIGVNLPGVNAFFSFSLFAVQRLLVMCFSFTWQKVCHWTAVEKYKP